MNQFYRADSNNRDKVISLQSELIKGKKLIIYGCNDWAEQFCYHTGLEPSYYVDDSPLASEFAGVPVLNVYDLLYLNPNEWYVAVIKPERNLHHISRTMSACGYFAKRHYAILCEAPLKANVIINRDAHLGHSRVYDRLEGFEIYGRSGAKFKIAALGGSTTDPFYNDGRSWPEALYEILKAKGIDAQVYNGGFCGYTSSQELIKLIRDVLTLSPDIIVSYSGVNDFSYEDYIPDHNRYKRPHLLDSQEVLYRWISEREGKSVLYGLQSEKSSAESWMDNIRTMNAVTKEFGIKLIAFLQPCAYCFDEVDALIDSIQHTISLHSNTYTMVYKNFKYIREAYNQAEKLINGHSNIKSLTGLFKSSEDLFLDACHVTLKGNRIIAAHIYEELCQSGMLPQQEGCK